MSENENEWVLYDGNYEKKFYDVKLKDGNIFPHCWPNAGTWYSMVGEVIKGSDVEYIRITNRQ